MPFSSKLSLLRRTFSSKSPASSLLPSLSSSSSATEKKPLGSFSSNPGVSEYTDCGRLQQESNIFNSLGRLQQESTAEKFLRAIHDCGEIENASELIFSYAANLPNLAIEEVILKYQNLHEKLKLNPSSTSSGKLITHCCNLHEVSTALDLAEKMGDSGPTLAPEVLIDIVRAFEDMVLATKTPSELGVVVALARRIRSLIHHQNSRLDLANHITTEEEKPDILNEIKNALVFTLSSNGHLSHALVKYDEIKKNGGRIDPRVSIGLLKNLQGEEGHLDRNRKILADLSGPDDLVYWIRGSREVFIYYYLYGHVSAAVELLQEFRKITKIRADIIVKEVFSFVLGEGNPAAIGLGLKLLGAIQADLRISSVRIVLDFLLSACVNSKDDKSARLIWQKYHDAGLPYNVISYLRMYQVIKACGDHHTAKDFREKISEENPHVKMMLGRLDSIYAPACRDEDL